ncbi:radical SAM (seleno)protein TrsS [Telmatospirillum siberiense]|nr:radical SAM (seleno)protein TrsS [Telmatospirillum siberiense]
MNKMATVRAGTVAGLVLAAGYSSRMGAFKPLLRLGRTSTIEHVVGLFRRSGIAAVTVVVGHRADEMIPIVESLGATPVFNADFDQGMYSSIRAGISALSDECGGCLLLPVDIPLVRPSTIERLRRSFANRHASVLYPVFQGRHGHPPLISRALFPEILDGDGAGGLCTILARHAAEAENVAVYDEGIHRDMDTPADYAALCAAAQRTEIPGLAECEAILADMQPNRDVIAHGRLVAAVAGRLATSLIEAGLPLNADLVLAGSLLHDVAKGQSDHAIAGALQMERLGYPEVARIVACHSDLEFFGGDPDERAVVFLADKLVQGVCVVSLEERFQRTFHRLEANPAGLKAARGRFDTALRITGAMERRMGRSLRRCLAPLSPQPMLAEKETPVPAAETAVLGTTESVCPVCLRQVPAERVQEGDAIYLRKTCPDHGAFKTVTWRGADSYHAWGGSLAAFSAPAFPATEKARGCPYDCGLCADHRQQSCCVLVEVTERCNLSCPVCFAEAGGSTPDPDLDEISRRLAALRKSGRQVNIQLSGGEPTLRDDLPEIVALTRRMGFDFVQVNTNGIRLARDDAYVRRLKEAGLECVFLQFDGLSDDVYRAIRGADLLDLKMKAIDACAKYRIGVVLVPVLVPGVNMTQLGDIIRFAAARSPHVRTVHFQPISYFGRYPGQPGDEARVTIPEVLAAIEAQMGQAITAADFRPGTAENPYCSFNGDFIVGADGELTSSLAPAKASGCCGSGAGAPAAAEGATADEAERARRFVARRWAAPDQCCASPSDGTAGVLMKADSLDAFLASRKRTLCISGMAFQDAWTLDLDRLRQCYIHVATPDQRLVPLCAFNLSGMNGETIYRRPRS